MPPSFGKARIAKRGKVSGANEDSAVSGDVSEFRLSIDMTENNEHGTPERGPVGFYPLTLFQLYFCRRSLKFDDARGGASHPRGCRSRDERECRRQSSFMRDRRAATMTDEQAQLTALLAK